MYAVIFQKGLLYLGHDQIKALDVFKSKSGSEIHKVQSPKTLSCLVDNENEEHLFDKNTEGVSGAAKELFKKLERLGLSEQQAVGVFNKSCKAEVKYLGSKIMKTACGDFINLSDLLKDNPKETQ